jgi:chaperonin GroES
MNNLIPLNGNIIIKPLEEQETTYGNIVIPDMGKEKPEIGIVMSVSDTLNWHTGEYVRSLVKPGDKVLIPKMGAVSFTLNGEDFYITKETEILAIYE